MDTSKEEVIAAMEETARATGLKLTTIGRKVEQGGLFYERLQKPETRIWPQTAGRVLQMLHDMREENIRHSLKGGAGSTSVQPPTGDAA